METELDPNFPNRTRTLAARVDHPNSCSIVTPAGLTLPESGPPGKRAREWPGVAPFAPAWGCAIPIPKSSRRCEISRTLEGSRAVPGPAVPVETPVMPAATPVAEIFTRRTERSRPAWKCDGCPPRHPSPKASLDAPKGLGLHGNATGRRVRRLFRQKYFGF